jgi:adenosylcobinamide kinase/adenosylcobinamide-phosphate guanylyltransferase
MWLSLFKALSVASSGRTRHIMSSVARLTLVLGGARSGKSRYAESLIAAAPPPWTYVATAAAGDDEMAERIARHRARRGPNWRTIEATSHLDRVLAERKSEPVLVDCLTLWLSNVMLANGALEDEMARVEQALQLATAPKVVVANEVGYGIVPDHPLGRRFRDAQGIFNQRIAALADRVVLVVAGIPLAVKGSL